MISVGGAPDELLENESSRRSIRQYGQANQGTTKPAAQQRADRLQYAAGACGANQSAAHVPRHLAGCSTGSDDHHGSPAPPAAGCRTGRPRRGGAGGAAGGGTASAAPRRRPELAAGPPSVPAVRVSAAGDRRPLVLRRTAGSGTGSRTMMSTGAADGRRTGRPAGGPPTTTPRFGGRSCRHCSTDGFDRLARRGPAGSVAVGCVLEHDPAASGSDRDSATISRPHSSTGLCHRRLAVRR